MDGNLLDEETADEALTTDWNLPELPEGNSSLPSTSQELAEIFGTSDDEEDVDFPFSLSSGLPGELALPNTTDAKKFESSLLGNTDSELFLNSFHDTLRNMTPVPVSIGQPAKGMVAQDKGGDKLKGNDKPNNIMPNEKGAELDAQEGKTRTGDKSSLETESEAKFNTEGEEKQTTKELRKSARLRGRGSFEDRSHLVVKKICVAKVKQEPDVSGDTTAIKKEPEVKTEDKEEVKGEAKQVKEAEPQQVKEEPVKEEDKRYVKSEESESAGETSESEDESDEDPDRLWCVCQQPHNDRFMICCDQCEEWYHGECVGISVGQGKRMEREGKEYVCPVCIARIQDAKEEREIDRSARQARREETREKEIKKKVGPVHRRISTGASHAPKPDGDQYGMSQLFLPDNAPKDSLPSKEKKVDGTVAPSKTEHTKNKKEESAPSHCVGPGCDKVTTPPSVYCSQACVEKHASLYLKKLSERGVLHSSNPSEFVRGTGGISVVEKGTGKLLVGMAAPSEKNLVPWLMEHPSYQVYLHAKTRKLLKNKAPKKPKPEKKEPESPTSKMPKIPLMDPKSVRANAKKALFQTLWKRCEDVSDLSDLDQEAVEKVANDIEEKLHNLYQDINPKYKNKYRSLLFNLKDTKNPGLFRKVLRGDIETRQLVRMSSEKLASEDLSHWREQTIKKDLEKIMEREEDAVSHGGNIRKKTYKGEVEIENEEKIEIETIDTTKDPTTVSTKSHSETTKSQSDTTKSHSQSKSQPEHTFSLKSTKPSGSILDLLTDTTSQHDNHVYDHHCAICNGKVKRPPTPPPIVDESSHPSPDDHTTDDDVMDTTPPHTTDEEESHAVKEEPSIWRGEFTMHGMARFSATAYAVSGPVEFLEEIFPPVLEVMGRIAHVQVWDYVDKLRSSTSRDIVVLRFDPVDEDTEPYMAMLNYLVGKHRCGVLKSGYHGIKDMYLLPLLSQSPVASQLLPFDGPGLPFSRPDLLLGVIIRSKHKKRPSISQRLSTQPALLGAMGAPPPVLLPTSSETGIKRHNSASSDTMSGGHKVKKTRMQLEIGIGGQTPPTLDQTSPIEEREKSEDAESPYEPGSLDPLSEDVKEGEERLMKKIQMSFYGEHRPMETTPENNVRVQSESPPKTVGVVSNSVMATVGSMELSDQSTTSSSFQSFLSQLSKEKIEELASVVSSIGGQPGSAGTSAAAGGSTSANQSPAKQASATSGDSRSNLEMLNAIPPAKATGSPQPQLNADYAVATDQGQIQVAPSVQVHGGVGSYGNGQWNQEQTHHPSPQPQFYQTAQYSTEPHQTTANAAAGENHQVYPVQGGGPYANYPPVRHREGRASVAAAATTYMASQDHQQYRGDQHPRPTRSQRHTHSHQPRPPHWDQHHQQDYGHSHSHYHHEGRGNGGYRDGYGENRMPHPHDHGKPGGWDRQARGGHRGRQFHGRGDRGRYNENWHRGDHDRDRQWR